MGSRLYGSLLISSPPMWKCELNGELWGRTSLKRVVRKGGMSGELIFSWLDGGSMAYVAHDLL